MGLTDYLGKKKKIDDRQRSGVRSISGKQR